MNLLDTDITFGLLRERKPEMGSISIIMLIDILRGLEDGKRIKVRDLLEESFNVQGLDNETIETHCHLYRRLKKGGILIPDTLTHSCNSDIKKHDTENTG